MDYSVLRKMKEWVKDIPSGQEETIKEKTLLIGIDCGSPPGAMICRISEKGEILVIDEVCPGEMKIFSIDYATLQRNESD